MQPIEAAPSKTGYALFDSEDRLVDANAEIMGGGVAASDLAPRAHLADLVSRTLEQLRSFDGRPVKRSEAFVQSAANRWRKTDEAPVEAETLDGRWKLLAAHPRAEGGFALVSVDI